MLEPLAGKTSDLESGSEQSSNSETRTLGRHKMLS
jgi:hypothetical protein